MARYQNGSGSFDNKVLSIDKLYENLEYKKIIFWFKNYVRLWEATNGGEDL